MFYIYSQSLIHEFNEHIWRSGDSLVQVRSAVLNTLRDIYPQIDRLSLHADQSRLAKKGSAGIFSIPDNKTQLLLAFVDSYPSSL